MLTQDQTSTPRQRPVNCERERGRLLIVRHGPDRGPKIRLRRFRLERYQPMFDDILVRYPRLSGRIAYWETGRPMPDLAGVAAIVFVLQDPLRELHPDCFDEASTLATAARTRGIHLVNPPDSLSSTIKSVQSRLWREAGFQTPRCDPFSSVEQLMWMAQETDGPFLIKSDTSHSQHGMLYFDGAAQLSQLPREQIPGCGAFSPLIDTKSGWERIAPGSPYATHYHKKRAMVFGDHVCNNHVFFADQPIVGVTKSTFGHYRNLNPITRFIRNARIRDHLETDFQYWSEPPEAPELFIRATSALGLEMCAIDYSTTSDGEVVLWEANPYFSLHLWPIAVLKHKRRLSQRLPRTHDTAAKFFLDLLGGDAC